MADVQKRFSNLLGDRDGRAYVESIVIAVSNNSNLQMCSPKSIMISAMRAASLKLSVDPIMKQAHLVPMGKEATLIVDYHGIVQLSVNTGYYEIAPNVFEIWEGETVKMDRFSGKISLEGERASDTVIGWCGYFKAKNGTERWLYMTNEECDAHGKKYSKAFNSPKSGWTTEREKMRRKTVLRLLVSRWGNFSPQVQNVIMQEEPAIDAEAFELPDDSTVADVHYQASGKTPDELIQEMGFGDKQ
jgi:recombination protein RecT